MTIEERIDRLEELYEKIYHTNELLSIYIPRLTNILINASKQRYTYNDYLRSVMKVLSGELDAYNKELREHFQSHYIDKKKRIEYASKRRHKY